ncbi:MAG TPA: 3-methyl-2-oxobutanoate hydroxymethyltransferase [Candidatus Copromorpha excrementigallinarum]|uniref:3-methyl-2-oxobutanoate hydroxymethyltransferase n=1 Tax=Candidatus Allocopromorpha excrementigallinarum TaxID=2840742 RepID=A0A9D1I0V3_9FIRM|nr:3-methyl-2-oxobutanoate hydroxymethyltransferase [Candidatus Copromorpha excrementigallinarum]
MKNTVASLMGMKEKGEKISMLTCYDYSTAKIIDAAGINSILVGDSLGNTMLGYPDTLSVTMEDMIHHGAAVVRGCTNTFVVIDMPFMSYQTSVYDALVNAGRLIKETGGNAVKLEGGAAVKEQIKAITDAGIPVVGHIGMTPQSVNAFGGFKVQGKSLRAAERIFLDAMDVQEAGAFAVVLECVPADLAAFISERLTIPTIGIGAGAGCDGQVLVWQDMAGLFTDYVPKFVKHFAEGGRVLSEAFSAYHREVGEGAFPGKEHSFKIDEGIMAELREKYRV